MENLEWILSEYAEDLIPSHIDGWATLPLQDRGVSVHKFDPFSFVVEADDDQRLREPGGGYFGDHVPKMKEFQVELTAWLKASTTRFGVTAGTEISYLEKIRELSHFFSIGQIGWFAWNDPGYDITGNDYKQYRMSARVIGIDYMSDPIHYPQGVRARIRFRSADPYIRVGDPVIYKLKRYLPVLERPDDDRHGTAPNYEWYELAGEAEQGWDGRYRYELDLHARQDTIFQRAAGVTMYPNMTFFLPGYSTDLTEQSYDARYGVEIANSRWHTNFNAMCRPGLPQENSNPASYELNQYYLTFRGTNVPNGSSYTLLDNATNVFEFWSSPQVRFGLDPYIDQTQRIIYDVTLPHNLAAANANTASRCHLRLLLQPRMF